MLQRKTFDLSFARTAGMLSGARRVAILLAVMMLTTVTAWAQETISGLTYNGTGGYYEIPDAAALNALATYVNGGNNASGKTFKMTDNITYDGTANNYTPIGDGSHIFNGTFDGNGKTISGININSSSDYKGIFGFVDGTVKNLVVSNSSIEGKTRVGVIAGTLRSGTIENCRVGSSVTLSGDFFVGGIVGESTGGTVKGCTSAAAITGTSSDIGNASKLGGIVGYASTSAFSNSTLTDNIFTGTITGALSEYIGAIVGQNDGGTLTNNLSTSTGFGGVGASGSTTGANVDGATYTIDWATQNDGNSEATAYIINNKYQLNLLALRVNGGNTYSGKYFKLGFDIVYDKNTENNFTTIGVDNNNFYGTFDGNGKTISGIRINTTTQYQGIFGSVGYLHGGTVKNLVVSDCRIEGSFRVGIIAGYLYHGTIENCHVGNDVTLSGNLYVGGIVGESAYGGTIKGCTSAATITGTKSSGMKAIRLGGVVGGTSTSPSSTLTDNIFTGTINGDLDKYIGAIVGDNSTGTLTNNYHTSTGFGGIGAAGSATGADANGARQALTISAATDVTLTPTGSETAYSVSGITVYSDNSGMGYDGKLYAGATDEVKLTLSYSGSVPAGYILSYSDGNGNALTDNGNGSYTLTMPAANVTVSAIIALDIAANWYAGADNSTAISDYNRQTITKVTLADRTLYKNGDWNTLCLPFALSEAQIAASPLAGFIIKEMLTTSSLDNTGKLTLNFTDATAIEAGKPYIVKWNPAAYITSMPLFNLGDAAITALNFISEVPTVTGGQATNWGSGEGYSSLVDGNTGTKYGLSNNNPWVQFNYANPITPKGYALWTAGDAEDGSRNPTSWTIKAKNDGDADWTTLVTVDNSDGSKLPKAINTRTVFALDNSTAYKYFRFEATLASNGQFQLAELQFCTVQPTITLANITNPAFNNVTIDAIALTEVTSTDGNVKFVGTYSPFATTDGLLLDAHNTANGAFHAAVSAIRDGYAVDSWYTDAGKTTEATTIPFAADGSATLYVKFVPVLSETTGITDAASLQGKTAQFSRTFTAGVASTICLPFPMTGLAENTVYEMTSMDKNGAYWVATMTSVTSTEAGKPYLIKTAGEVVFNGTVPNDFDGTAKTSSADYNGDGTWTFRGTYATLTYGTNLDGAVYGFAGAAYDGGSYTVSPGDFVKAETGAYILPFRCYLTYNAPLSSARSMTRGADIELPSRIIVRLVGLDGQTTAIGSMDTKTGEVSFDGSDWYTLDGRQLIGKPTQRGIYINNGKKVIVK